MAKKENRHAELVSASANIEAPYELPERWKWVTIGDCCEKAFSGKSPKYSKEITPYKIIGQQANQRYGIDLTFIKYGTKEFAEAQQDFYYLQYNDVLLNTLGTGSIGRSGIYKYDEKILTDGHPFVFRTEKKYVADLLFYYLRLNEQEIINTANGSTNQKFLSLKTFLKFPIPLPPTLAEQKRIVNRIETMFAKLDEAKEKAQNVVDSFETRKAAILHKAFTGELTANWRKENGVPDDSWEEKLFQELIIGTPQNGMYKSKEYYGNGTKILRIDCFYDGSIVSWDLLKRLQISDEELKTYHLDLNDVVINRVNSMPYLGKSALIRKLPEKCVFESNMMRIKLQLNLLHPEYIIIFLNSTQGLLELRKNAKQAVNQASINQQDVKNVIVPVPTLPEQQEIVRILDSILEKESRAKEAAQTVLNQIALLKKSILARAFRGEL